MSKQAIALYMKQKRLSTANRGQNNEQQQQKKFEKDMVKRKAMLSGRMPRTVFDFKMGQDR